MRCSATVLFPCHHIYNKLVHFIPASCFPHLNGARGESFQRNLHRVQLDYDIALCIPRTVSGEYRARCPGDAETKALVTFALL